jgi:surfactin synthase thioesterase subunit
MYLRWKRFLPHGINLIPLELPGRGTRLHEKPLEDFDTLVQTLLDDYQGDMQQPFAFFGHSMGALLAYGMGQALLAKKRISTEILLPEIMLLSACPSPDKFDTKRFPDTHNRDALITNLRQQGGTAEALFDSAELLEMTLNILAADYRLLQGFDYKQKPPLPLFMQILSGKSDDIRIEHLLSWQHHSSKALIFHEFNGGHFYIQDQQDLVLERITQALLTYAPIHKSENHELILA